MLFCLSLLQFEADFPLKFVMIDASSHQNVEQTEIECPVEKDVWLETQFLVSTLTSTDISISKELKLERKVFNFFKEFLLPTLNNFKNERINWVHMTS